MSDGINAGEQSDAEKGEMGFMNLNKGVRGGFYGGAILAKTQKNAQERMDGWFTQASKFCVEILNASVRMNNIQR